MKLPKSFVPKKDLEEEIKRLLKRKKRKKTLYEELLDCKIPYKTKIPKFTEEFTYKKGINLPPPILVDKEGKLWKPEQWGTEIQDCMYFFCERDRESALIGYNLIQLALPEEVIQVKYSNVSLANRELRKLRDKSLEIIDLYNDILEKFEREIEEQ